MSLDSTRERINAIAEAFQKSRILLSAAELDLFDKLKDGPRRVEEIAQQEGWDARGLRILMDGLVVSGILSKTSEGKYFAKNEVLKLLTMGNEATILPLVLHRGSMWDTWSNITEIVKTGQNPRFSPSAKKDAYDLDSFIGAMHVLGRKKAIALLPALDFENCNSMLDIGGGSGVYTITFLKAYPKLRSTIVDMPEVIDIAKKWVSKERFDKRVTFNSGNYNKIEFPPNQDLALLSAIIHINSPEQNVDLYRRIFTALKPGGMLLIRDFLMDKSRTKPPAGAIFAVNMLAATRKGDSYRLEDVKQDLTSVGFVKLKLIHKGDDMDQVLSARKP
jgi:ubiquinone/menaquinone biosynthesis C-methylase UbiE